MEGFEGAIEDARRERAAPTHRPRNSRSVSVHAPLVDRVGQCVPDRRLCVPRRRRVRWRPDWGDPRATWVGQGDSKRASTSTQGGLVRSPVGAAGDEPPASNRVVGPSASSPRRRTQRGLRWRSSSWSSWPPSGTTRCPAGTRHRIRPGRPIRSISSPRDLDRVTAVAPVQVLGDQAVGAVEDEHARHPEHTVGLQRGIRVSSCAHRCSVVWPAKTRSTVAVGRRRPCVGGVGDPRCVRRAGRRARARTPRRRCARRPRRPTRSNQSKYQRPLAPTLSTCGALGDRSSSTVRREWLALWQASEGIRNPTDGILDLALSPSPDRAGAFEVPAMISATRRRHHVFGETPEERFRRWRDASTEGIGIRRDYRGARSRGWQGVCAEAAGFPGGQTADPGRMRWVSKTRTGVGRAMQAPGMQRVRRAGELAVTPNVRIDILRLDRHPLAPCREVLVQPREAVADIEANLPAVLNAISSMSGAARLGQARAQIGCGSSSIA